MGIIGLYNPHGAFSGVAVCALSYRGYRPARLQPRLDLSVAKIRTVKVPGGSQCSLLLARHKTSLETPGLVSSKSVLYLVFKDKHI